VPPWRGYPLAEDLQRPLGLEMISQLAGSEVSLSVKAHHLGGFTRSSAG
jgi:hypothetical protein